MAWTKLIMLRIIQAMGLGKDQDSARANQNGQPDTYLQNLGNRDKCPGHLGYLTRKIPDRIGEQAVWNLYGGQINIFATCIQILCPIHTQTEPKYYFCKSGQKLSGSVFEF